MNRHTPGPWTIEHREGMARIQYGDCIRAWAYSQPGLTDPRDVICDIKGTDRDANAVLIAAAPEMYAALRLYFDDPGNFHKAAWDIINKIDSTGVKS